VLINITGGYDLTLYEVNEAASIIREAADDDANIIFGAVIDETLHDEMKITVIATGFDKEIADVGSVATHAGAVVPPPRYTGPPTSDLPPRPGSGARADDLDVPTFIRKKAD
jgi:cell division protein FtsZ